MIKAQLNYQKAVNLPKMSLLLYYSRLCNVIINMHKYKMVIFHKSNYIIRGY